MDILDDIIANKRLEIAAKKSTGYYNAFTDGYKSARNHISMSRSLKGSDTGIISEFKRRSPSKGWINEHADPASVARAYAMAGVSAISVLTDSKFFGGNADDLIAVRKAVNVPILRKDFIIDEVQIAEADAIGADAVLLIAAALSVDECCHLASVAHSYGLETLLEIHSSDELIYVGDDIDMVGVNNRNLGTFHTDVGNSFRLAAILPKDRVLVSESGISAPETVSHLKDAGYRGFLIGEAFMRTSDPGEALGIFIGQLSGPKQETYDY